PLVCFVPFPAPTAVSTLSLHDALPIMLLRCHPQFNQVADEREPRPPQQGGRSRPRFLVMQLFVDDRIHDSDFGIRGKCSATLGRYNSTNATTATPQASTVNVLGNSTNWASRRATVRTVNTLRAERVPSRAL